MRRLHHRQPVEVSLDEEDEAISGWIAFVSGSTAVVTHEELLPKRVRARLTAGVLSYLAFYHRGARVALRGLCASTSDDASTLAFTVTDGVGLAERRGNERIPFRIPATVRNIGGLGAGAVATATADISLTGVLVERREGLPTGPAVELELSLPDGVPLRCLARIARHTPTHVGIAFTSLSTEDRVRLAGVIWRPQGLGANAA